MYRSHTCGELRISDINKQVTLSGWVQRSRKMGGMTFIDLRDRYGITQLVFNEEVDAELCEQANHLGREFVIQIVGTVNERFSKNKNIPTGDIEIIVSELNVLNSALTPPFTIEDNTDGGDDIRMKYRYLDLRRATVRKNLELRHKMTPMEKKLWYSFLRTYPVKMYKQRPIRTFVADFYCPLARLVIELDGSQHYTEQGMQYDKERSAVFEQYGVQVLRFRNQDVSAHFEMVCEQIHEAVVKRLEELERGKEG